MPEKSIQFANEDGSSTYVKISVQNQNNETSGMRSVKIKLEASEDIIGKGVYCILDEDRVILSDDSSEFSFIIPEDVEGELEFVAVGYSDKGDWAVDIARTVFDGSAPESISIENVSPITLAVGQMVDPLVFAKWKNGETAEVEASLSLADNEDGAAEMSDGMIVGRKKGQCSLVAEYRGLTVTVPVIVMDISSVHEIEADNTEDVLMFKRGSSIVARLLSDYDGNVDMELFNMEGQLISRVSTGGRFSAGDEVSLDLPSASGDFYVVRCRREGKNPVSMKIVN